MDLAKVLQQLHEELENLNAAISSLERLQETGKRRSKEPDWLSEVSVGQRPRKRKAKAKASGRGGEGAEPGGAD